MFSDKLKTKIQEIGGVEQNQFISEIDISPKSFSDFCKDNSIKVSEEFIELINALGFCDFKELIKCKTVESIPVSSEENTCSIGTIYGNGTGNYSIQNLMTQLKEQISEEYIPFAEGASGDYLCVGIAEYNYDEIYYWHHESPEEEDMYLIAIDLSSFIEGLQIKETEPDTSNFSVTDNIEPDSEFAKFLESTSDTGWKSKNKKKK